MRGKKEFWSPRQAGAHIGVHAATIIHWIKEAFVAAFDINGRYFIPRAEFLETVERWKQGAIARANNKGTPRQYELPIRGRRKQVPEVSGVARKIRAVREVVAPPSRIPTPPSRQKKAAARKGTHGGRRVSRTYKPPVLSEEELADTREWLRICAADALKKANGSGFGFSLVHDELKKNGIDPKGIPNYMFSLLVRELEAHGKVQRTGRRIKRIDHPYRKEAEFIKL